MLSPAEFQVPPINPAQNQNCQPFDPTHYGQTSFSTSTPGTPQYYPGQQQPVISNQPQYEAPPLAGQY